MTTTSKQTMHQDKAICFVTKYGEIVDVNEIFCPSLGWRDSTVSGTLPNILKNAKDAGCTSENIKIKKQFHPDNSHSEVGHMDFTIAELEDGGMWRIRRNWDRLSKIESNQARRDANLIAIDRKRQLALYEYIMPAGSTALVAISPDPEKYPKSVNYRTMPKYWFDLIREQNTDTEPNDIICGQSQKWGCYYQFPTTGYKLEQLEYADNDDDRACFWF